jgi:hypothetical protein
MAVSSVRSATRARDVLGELHAHVVDRAGGVLGDVVQQARDLDVLGIAGVARDVGDRLGVGEGSGI